MTITLDEPLATRVAALAAEAGQSTEQFVERLLRAFVDDVRFEGRFPVLPVPPNAPVVTVEDVDRVLHGSDS